MLSFKILRLLYTSIDKQISFTVDCRDWRATETVADTRGSFPFDA